MKILHSIYHPEYRTKAFQLSRLICLDSCHFVGMVLAACWENCRCVMQWNRLLLLLLPPETKLSFITTAKLVSHLTIILNCNDYAKYLQAYACAILQQSFLWNTTTNWCKGVSNCNTNILAFSYNFNLIFPDI